MFSIERWLAVSSCAGVFGLGGCASEPAIDTNDAASMSPEPTTAPMTFPTPSGVQPSSPTASTAPEGSAVDTRPDVLPTAGPEPASSSPTPDGPAMSSGSASVPAAPSGPEPVDDPDPAGGPDVTPGVDDAAALEALEEYLAQSVPARPVLAEQAFAAVGLSREGAAQAGELLWADRAAYLAEERRSEHEAREITIGNNTLRFDFRTFGSEPEGGHSLYISLHGGGNADPSVNDEQWENQKILYEPDEGIYLAPRAPTDTWNLWHEAHIDPLFERLIANLIVLEGINPDRVYVMGYSAGGDGVYQLGPRMADHWAAASAMAGHPNEAKPFSLRNIGFTIHVGALDTAYDRNLVAQEWSDQLDELEAADPDGYPHVVEIHEGKPHWMDLEDAVAVPWMAEFTRNPTPNHVVWYQDDIVHQRFYWLAVDEPKMETSIDARISDQQIEIDSDDVSSVRLRLSDAMLDLDQDVTVHANGDEVFSGPVLRTIEVLERTMLERDDPRMMFSAETTVDW